MTDSPFFIPGLLAVVGLIALVIGLFKSFAHVGDKRKSGFEHPLSIIGAVLLLLAAMAIMNLGGSIGSPH